MQATDCPGTHAPELPPSPPSNNSVSESDPPHAARVSNIASAQTPFSMSQEGTTGAEASNGRQRLWTVIRWRVTRESSGDDVFSLGSQATPRRLVTFGSQQTLSLAPQMKTDFVHSACCWMCA